MTASLNATTLLPSSSSDSYNSGIIISENVHNFQHDRTCTICGFDKKKSDFPKKRGKANHCKVCIFLKSRGLAYVYCETCQTSKPTIAFTSTKIDGIRGTCRVCCNSELTCFQTATTNVACVP